MVLQLVILVTVALVHDSTCSSSSRSSSAVCRTTPTLGNGNIIRNGNNIDYVCKPGYKLSVSGTCRRRSVRPQITCTEKECIGDPVPNSDDMTTKGTFGQVITYNCDSGYTANGPTSSKTCKDGGQGGIQGIWDSEVCEAVSCSGLVNNSDDTTLRGTFGQGQVVTFNCDDCFKANGANGSKICGEDGQWQINNPCEGNYNLTSLFVLVSVFKRNDVNQSECDQFCDGCSVTYLSNTNRCSVFKPPIISYTEDTTFDQCKEQCNQENDCLVFNHWASNFEYCYLYNVTLNAFPFEEFSSADYNGTLGEKICP